MVSSALLLSNYWLKTRRTHGVCFSLGPVFWLTEAIYPPDDMNSSTGVSPSRFLWIPKGPKPSTKRIESPALCL